MAQANEDPILTTSKFRFHFITADSTGLKIDDIVVISGQLFKVRYIVPNVGFLVRRLTFWEKVVDKLLTIRHNINQVIRFHKEY